MRILRFVPLLGVAVAGSLNGQFVPDLLENRSYWGDGKSEIDFYQVEFLRDAENVVCEVIMIFTPVFVDPNSLAVVENKQPGAVPAIRMIHTATIPRGLSAEPRSVDALWRMDSMSLARLSFSGSDIFGSVSKSVRERRETSGVIWSYQCDSYTGRSEPQPVPLGEKTVVAYEELPLRLRTLDFGKSTGEADIELAPSLVSAAKEFGQMKPAKIAWKMAERTIDIEVQHSLGKDLFTLDSNFPHLLRDWQAWDRTHWKMKNSIRADYTKYLKKGDRERAFKDPMLRHPD